MSLLPPVSCLCLTYGRPHLLEEAIESFLRQDYQGPAELFILNDHERQSLDGVLRPASLKPYPFPEQRCVRIVNYCQELCRQVSMSTTRPGGERFRSIGQKRHHSVNEAAHNILLVWDDDDIFLPHRISYSVKKLLDGGTGFFKPSKAFTLNSENKIEVASNLFHSGACFTRELYWRAGGYPTTLAEDIGFEQKVAELIPDKNYDNIPEDEIYYIYRWETTKSYHVSAIDEYTTDDCVCLQKVDEALGEIANEKVTLYPRYWDDYEEMVKDYLIRR